MSQILNNYIFSNYFYALFHVLVLGSIIFSKIFYKKMVLPNKKIMLKVMPVSLFFIIWDFFVTNSWWYFNDEYLLNLPKIFTIPIEELLFFFTVPFGLLTFLENAKILFNKEDNKSHQFINKKILKILLTLFLTIIFLYSLSNKWWYTITIIFGFIYLLDDVLKINKVKLLGLFFTIITTLIFNFYLTSLPIVTYNNVYKSGILITTIPLEDFGYGLILYLLITKFAYEEKKPLLS